MEKCGLDSSDSGEGPVAGSSEHSNEPSGSVKADNLLTSCVAVSSSRRVLLHGVSLVS
jgi:hypothetical protein